MSDVENLVGRLCREQPALRAPASLSARVLAEIERRSALPWWRRAFTHWPVPVRAAFVAACAAVVWTSLSAPMARMLAAVSAPMTWALHAGAAVSLLNSVFGRVSGDLAHSLSPLLLYGSVLTVGALYVVFAGLCATTYRTLYLSVERNAGIKL
jgi:hypothetical protein